jgi:hypothetical protein
LVVAVEGESATGDPKFKKVAVVSGRFALFEKQDVREGDNEWHRPEREAELPEEVEEAEQNQDHADGKGSGSNDGHEEIAVESKGRSGGIIRRVGVGESQVVHRLSR